MLKDINNPMQIKFHLRTTVSLKLSEDDPPESSVSSVGGVSSSSESLLEELEELSLDAEYELPEVVYELPECTSILD